MNDTLLRLGWALPLVLLLGIVVLLVLRRLLPQLAARPPATAQLVLAETLQVSPRTRVHLLQVQGRPVLLLEPEEGAASAVPLDERPRAPLGRSFINDLRRP